MEIEEFISLIEKAENSEITRGAIIDYIAGNEDDWVLAIKALLIVTPKRYMHRGYLLEKLAFMKNNPDPYLFLSRQPLIIYNVLKGDYK